MAIAAYLLPLGLICLFCLACLIWARAHKRALAGAGDPATPHDVAQAGIKHQAEHLYAIGVQALRNDQFAQAATTLALAAQRGHPRAQLHYGVLCEHGIGMAVDRERAVHWYEQAVAQGDVDAYFRLQIMQAEAQIRGRCKVRAFSATIAADDPLLAPRVPEPQSR